MSRGGSTWQWRQTRAAVLNAHGWTCQLCGAALHPRCSRSGCDRCAHVDHVVPVARGGTDAPANLRAACQRCNLSRGKNGQLVESSGARRLGAGESGGSAAPGGGVGPANAFAGGCRHPVPTRPDFCAGLRVESASPILCDRQRELTVLAGMPGSGKSHWRRNQPRDAVRNALTLDGGRGMGTGSQGGMSSLYGRARRLLVDGKPVVADVTACRADDRAEWIAIARNADATTRIVVFTTPVEVCVARNARRPKGRRVPDERMAFYAGMHTCLPTIVAGEDWDEVVMVDGR